jgi:copper chaperone CopZ
LGSDPNVCTYAWGVITEVFEVEGVHCPRCIEKIAAALTGVDGLLAADANLMGEISVRLDGPSAHERVQAALEGAGFPVAAVRAVG